MKETIDLTVDHIYQSGDNDIRFKEMGLRLYENGIRDGKILEREEIIRQLKILANAYGEINFKSAKTVRLIIQLISNPLEFEFDE